MFRLRFEINPVDMKAVGSGFAILYDAGVANEEPSELWLALVSIGREDPMGRERENLGRDSCVW